MPNKVKIPNETNVKNHPTISQDWTKKEVNDQKRLVALQGKKPCRSLRENIDKLGWSNAQPDTSNIQQFPSLDAPDVSLLDFYL